MLAYIPLAYNSQKASMLSGVKRVWQSSVTGLKITLMVSKLGTSFAVPPFAYMQQPYSGQVMNTSSKLGTPIESIGGTPSKLTSQLLRKVAVPHYSWTTLNAVTVGFTIFDQSGFVRIALLSSSTTYDKNEFPPVIWLITVSVMATPLFQKYN